MNNRYYLYVIERKGNEEADLLITHRDRNKDNLKLHFADEIKVKRFEEYKTFESALEALELAQKEGLHFYSFRAKSGEYKAVNSTCDDLEKYGYKKWIIEDHRDEYIQNKNSPLDEYEIQDLENNLNHSISLLYDCREEGVPTHLAEKAVNYAKAFADNPDWRN